MAFPPPFLPQARGVIGAGSEGKIANVLTRDKMNYRELGCDEEQRVAPHGDGYIGSSRDAEEYGGARVNGDPRQKVEGAANRSPAPARRRL